MVRRYFAVVFFFIGLIVYLGFFSYKKILEVTLASGNTDFYTGAKNAIPTTVWSLQYCKPGEGVANLVAPPEISLVPANVKLGISEKLRLINADSMNHFISFAFTNLSFNLEAGTSIDLYYQNFPKDGNWGIICDDIYLGEKSPTVVVLEP